ncbi:unnamed protein product [Symbiodinium sp. CCMP2592]|nr:unnamed protein product [Symbiodinium sp. CCMP2592]
MAKPSLGSQTLTQRIHGLPASTGDQDDTWAEASADSDPKNPWPADEGWDNTWDFPDPTNDEIYESFIETMGVDLDEEARLHTPSFRTNNTIAVDLVQEQPEQPGDGQNDDLVNHDMQEAKEAHATESSDPHAYAHAG